MPADKMTCYVLCCSGLLLLAALSIRRMPVPTSHRGTCRLTDMLRSQTCVPATELMCASKTRAQPLGNISNVHFDDSQSAACDGAAAAKGHCLADARPTRANCSSRQPSSQRCPGAVVAGTTRWPVRPWAAAAVGGPPQAASVILCRPRGPALRRPVWQCCCGAREHGGRAP